MTGSGVEIAALPLGALDELEPLWNALREHHAAAAPEFGAPRDRSASWAIRSTQYSGWLDAGEGAALVARDATGSLVGYAFVRVHGPDPIWPTDAAGELETLSVLPGSRSGGVGAALIDATWAWLAESGITAMSIVVLHTNHDGLRFYRREGFDSVTHTLWGEAPSA